MDKEYTNETPTEAGWYWMIWYGEETIKQVFIRPGHSYLAIWMNKYVADYMPVQKMDALWCGPIKKPIERKDDERI